MVPENLNERSMGGYGGKQQQLYHEVIMKCRLANVLIFPLGDTGKWVLALVFYKALLLICLSLSLSLIYLFILLQWNIPVFFFPTSPRGFFFPISICYIKERQLSCSIDEIWNGKRCVDFLLQTEKTSGRQVLNNINYIP